MWIFKNFFLNIYRSQTTIVVDLCSISSLFYIIKIKTTSLTQFYVGGKDQDYVTHSVLCQG